MRTPPSSLSASTISLNLSEEEIKGLVIYCLGLDLSTDCRTIVSSSLEGTVRLWNLATRLEVAQFEMESDVISVAFAPDGNSLHVTQSESGQVGSSPQKRNRSREPFRRILAHDGMAGGLAPPCDSS